jgi:hypothetical protein
LPPKYPEIKNRFPPAVLQELAEVLKAVAHQNWLVFPGFP